MCGKTEARFGFGRSGLSPGPKGGESGQMAGPPRGAKPAEWRSHHGGQSRPNGGRTMGGKAGRMAVASWGAKPANLRSHKEYRIMDRFV